MNINVVWQGENLKFEKTNNYRATWVVVVKDVTEGHFESGSNMSNMSSSLSSP